MGQIGKTHISHQSASATHQLPIEDLDHSNHSIGLSVSTQKKKGLSVLLSSSMLLGCIRKLVSTQGIIELYHIKKHIFLTTPNYHMGT